MSHTEILFLLSFTRMVAEPENPLQPIFESPRPVYSAEDILYILLDPKIDSSRICKQRPTNIRSSSAFVIDVTSLQHPDDIKKDSFGKWQHSGSHTITFKVDILENDIVDVHKAEIGETGSGIYYLRRLNSTHPSNSKCKRLIAHLSGKYYYVHKNVS